MLGALALSPGLDAVEHGLELGRFGAGVVDDWPETLHGGGVARELFVLPHQLLGSTLPRDRSQLIGTQGVRPVGTDMIITFLRVYPNIRRR